MTDGAAYYAFVVIAGQLRRDSLRRSAEHLPGAPMALASHDSAQSDARDYSHEPVVVYLRPGETGWVRAAPGLYHLRLAEGRQWFGPELLFGPSVLGWGGSDAVESPAAAVSDDEPFASYGTSKWHYPPLWLYRTRAKRQVKKKIRRRAHSHPLSKRCSRFGSNPLSRTLSTPCSHD
jgi:hypothetical protein